MRVLFVGSNPSIKNDDPNIPFKGTRSETILKKWIETMALTDYQIVNVLDEATPGNRALTRGEIKRAIKSFAKKLEALEYDRVVALGNSASVALKILNVNHYKLPHPSPVNRLLNSPTFVTKELDSCKVYIYESK